MRLPDGYLRVDQTLRILRVSQRPSVEWLRPLGPEVLGRRLGHVLPAAMAETYLYHIELARTFGRPIPFVYEWVRDGMARVRLAWVRPVGTEVELLVCHLGTRPVARG